MRIDAGKKENIYKQIVENIKMQITCSILKPNEKLPSVRELAVSLMINPNTVQKAYDELRSLGYIVTLQGKGNFVAESTEQIREKTFKESMESILEEIDALLKANFDKDRIIEIIKKGRYEK